jgi:hypothetical protein
MGLIEQRQIGNTTTEAPQSQSCKRLSSASRNVRALTAAWLHLHEHPARGPVDSREQVTVLGLIEHSG